jgi:hypothetical protein
LVLEEEEELEIGFPLLRYMELKTRRWPVAEENRERRSHGGAWLGKLMSSRPGSIVDVQKLIRMQAMALELMISLRK